MPKKTETAASADVLHYNNVRAELQTTGFGEPLALPNVDEDNDGIDDFWGKPIFTTEEAAQQLNREGAIWNVGPNGTITFTFAEHAPGGQYNNPHEGLGPYIDGFMAFTPAQRAATREAIQLWDDLIAPSFVEKNGYGADIVYMNTSTGPAQAAAYTPFYGGGHGRYAKIQGDTFVNQDQYDNFHLDPGGYGFTTLVHETGHAIGLEHPGDYNFAVGGVIEYDHDAIYFQDSQQYTIMSYFDAGYTGAAGYVNWASGGFYQHPQTPMVHDIAAVQAMYGADTTTRTGDTTYGFNSTADRAVFDFTENLNPFVTIYDAGGHDTLDLSGFYGDVTLDLREGEFSSGYAQPDYEALNEVFFEAPEAFWDALYAGQLPGNPGFLSDNIGIAFGTVIEDGVTGAGDDTLIGNDADNRLDGGAGIDFYTGGLGADIFVIADAGPGDLVSDFEAGIDKLDLSAFGIDESNVAIVGNQVQIDTNANGTPDMLVILTNDAPIQYSDMIFG